ncbi:metal ABC transporter substrate-binding protein [Olsenella massiliensis]|uniref:metal ABC transporter substrate-binding protein n=1 Tax=Olsenella massiliensis TaxID=1622075 RepID=UPI0009E906BD|nr:metal ABC transporter substrate-binding protein [Olsenella massiliensis]
MRLPVTQALPSYERLKRRCAGALLALLGVVLSLSLLSACPSGPTAGAGRKPKVLTTFTVIQDMAQTIAGDHLNVQSITRPGAEIHDYEPTPEDIARAADADLVLDNGLGLERWFERFMTDSHARRVTLSDGVEPMRIAEGEYAGNANPHAWMSPANGKTYVDNIVTAFCELDRAHADEYRRNGEAYKRELDGVSDELREGLSQLPEGQRTLVTCEGAFSYLCRDTGLRELYLWPVNAENEGTPQQVAAVVAGVRAAGVPAVFCESTVSPKPMRQVADETGATLWTDADHMLYVDSLSDADGPVPTYLELLRHDAHVIVEGLAKGGAR